MNGEWEGAPFAIGVKSAVPDAAAETGIELDVAQEETLEVDFAAYVIPLPIVRFVMYCWRMQMNAISWCNGRFELKQKTFLPETRNTQGHIKWR